MRWLLQRLAQLPFGPDTQRAIEETVADAITESRETKQPISRMTALARGLAAITRVISLAFTSFVDGEHPMRFLGHDIRAAARRLRQSPGFAIFSVLTLALGIGGTTAVSSVIQSTLHAPLAFDDPARVMNIYGTDFVGRTAGWQYELSIPDVDDIRARQTSFTGVLLWQRLQGSWAGDTQTVVGFGEIVSGNYFDVLGVGPQLGRVLQPADDQPNAANVVVLSDDCWNRLFLRDPAIVGRTIRIRDTPFEVIGVAAAEFRGVDMPSVTTPRGWIAFSSVPRMSEARLPIAPINRDRGTVLAKGRLKPGVSREAAASEILAIGAQLDQVYPRRIEDSIATRPRHFTLLPAVDLMMHESTHAIAGVFANTVMIALGLVLLIACTNIANLQLGRLSARRQELAVRLALGASRWRIVREMTVEAATVSVVGAGAGLLVAWWLVRVMTTGIEFVNGIVIDVHPQLDVRAVMVATTCALLSTLVAGVVPAWHATRQSPRTGAASQGSQTSARWRGRRFVVGAQVAASVVLLGLAGVFAHRAVTVFSSDLGIDYAPLVAAQFDLSALKDSEQNVRTRLDHVWDAVRRSPDVRHAFIASGLPIGFSLSNAGIATHVVAEDNWPAMRYPNVLAGTSGVFPALGLKIVEGRALNDADGEQGESVGVLTRSTANDLFKPGSAVGAVLQVRRPLPVQKTSSDWEWKPIRIVGVIDDVDVTTPGDRRRGLLVVPFTQWSMSRPIVGARMNAHATSAMWLKDVVTKTDRELPLLDARTGDSLLNVETLMVRVGTVLTVSMGAMALLLGLVGLSGVLGHMVTTRTREIGIRIALGADIRRVLRMIVGDGMRPVVFGLIVGSGLAWLAIRATGAFVQRLGGLPPIIMLCILAVMLAAGFVACYIPARRASRVDPNVALRNL